MNSGGERNAWGYSDVRDQGIVKALKYGMSERTTITVLNDGTKDTAGYPPSASAMCTPAMADGLSIRTVAPASFTCW